MKKIFLGGKYGSVIGNYALVDDKDFDYLNQWGWFAHQGASNSRYLYARKRRVGRNPKTHYVQMHRLLLKAPKGKMVDHINHNGLDNRRKNLRLCTNSQNQMNRGKAIHNSSGFKGVTWTKADRQWRAQIQLKGKRIYLGQFKTKELAVKAYKKAAKKYHGKFFSL